MRKMFEQCNIWGWKDWSWNISDNVVCVRYQRRIQIKSISNFSTPEGSTLSAIEKKNIYIYRLIFRELNPLDVKRFLKHVYEF